MLTRYDDHTRQCRVDTDRLLRKYFYNPLRFSKFVPQTPPPTPDAGAPQDFEAFAMECLRCVASAMVECNRCRKKVTIHELEAHLQKCRGKPLDEAALAAITSELTSGPKPSKKQ
jgi:hypothetical protein